MEDYSLRRTFRAKSTPASIKICVSLRGAHVRESALRLGRGGYGKMMDSKIIFWCDEAKCSRFNHEAIYHNRKGGAFEIEEPKVGPKGESSGSERVKGHREHGVKK